MDRRPDPTEPETTGQAESRLPGVPCPPAHLSCCGWLDYEVESALAFLPLLSAQLKKLRKKATADRVHDTRVALRRWFSVWAVLACDGFASRKVKKQAISELKGLLRLLGEIRDIDVDIELGQSLSVDPALIATWAGEAAGLRKKAGNKIKDIEIKRIVKRIKSHLRRRAARLARKASGIKEPAYQRLDGHLDRQEKAVSLLAATARTPEELHRLRLEIKRWRYLLSEFFGLSNRELVRLQQILGKMHDLDRLSSRISREPDRGTAARIAALREELSAELAELRRLLPYGLRPLQLESMRASTQQT